MLRELQSQNFNISRSALYIRLLPHRSSSHEGKRHVKTVPVKLIKAQNNHHMNHVDGKFCTSTINHLKELASIMGPKNILIVSQDDKARVPLGITAAKFQSPLIMHVDFKVILDDHDFVVGGRHKLIPSVYAGKHICFCNK